MRLIWSATWFGTDCEQATEFKLLLKEGHLTTGWKRDDREKLFIVLISTHSLTRCECLALFFFGELCVKA